MIQKQLLKLGEDHMLDDEPIPEILKNIGEDRMDLLNEADVDKVQ